MKVGVIDTLMMMTGNARTDADCEPPAFCLTASLIETLALMTDKAMAHTEGKPSEDASPEPRE